MVSHLHLNLCSSPMPFLFHANKQIKLLCSKTTWTIFVCVGILILLNLDKLHCIIIVMSCIHASHDHAESFAVVVSIASVACCFASSRIGRFVVMWEMTSTSKVPRQCFAGEPFSLYSFCVLLLLYFLASCHDALFESRVLSTCLSKAKP
jgi:hypothetical protein